MICQRRSEIWGRNPASVCAGMPPYCCMYHIYCLVMYRPLRAGHGRCPAPAGSCGRGGGPDRGALGPDGSAAAGGVKGGGGHYYSFTCFVSRSPFPPYSSPAHCTCTCALSSCPPDESVFFPPGGPSAPRPGHQVGSAQRRKEGAGDPLAGVNKLLWVSADTFRICVTIMT